jgi:hypothetical protein
MPDYKVGDVVIHTATETRMAVEKVKSDEVYCAWKAGDKFDSRWFPSATVRQAYSPPKAAAPPAKKAPAAKPAKAKKAKPAQKAKSASQPAHSASSHAPKEPEGSGS